MHNLLPLVKDEIGFSVSQDLIDSKDDQTVINNGLKKIKQENPFVAKFIEEYCKRFAESEYARICASICAITVYKLLRSQAEVDRMEEEINLN